MNAAPRRIAILAGLALALAGCGGGDSQPQAVTETVTVTAEDDGTETTTPDQAAGDSAPNGLAETSNVGDTLLFEGDPFIVSDVETSDESEIPDLLGEFEDAEGAFVRVKVTAEEADSAVLSMDFHFRLQLRGGDGVVYGDARANIADQQFREASDFIVEFDVPEEAVSGAVLEVGDGLNTVDASDVIGAADDWDPAYALRIDLGL